MISFRSRYHGNLTPYSGLQLIAAAISQLRVNSAVFAPSRADASAASRPPCPAPIATTSKSH